MRHGASLNTAYPGRWEIGGEKQMWRYGTLRARKLGLRVAGTKQNPLAVGAQHMGYQVTNWYQLLRT
jgi:hypothetical protein